MNYLKRIIRPAAAALAIALALTAPLFANPGEIDPSFSSGTSGTVGGIALQPDGRIILGGNFGSVNAQSRPDLARINADGSLDGSFPDPDVDSFVDCAVILPDGKILIGGDFTLVGGESRIRVARLNPDGSPDLSFPDLQVDASVRCMAVQPDGKILIGGDFTSVGNQARNRVARLNADGSLDPSFVDPLSAARVFSLAVQADGKILIGGDFSDVGAQPRERLARLNPDGTLDASFPNLSVNNSVRSIAVQADGRILLGGFFGMVAGQPRTRVARVNADGTLDPAFSVAVDAGGTFAVFSVVLQADGKILMTGSFDEVGGQPRSRGARLHSDGTLDTAFPDLDTDGNGTFTFYPAIQADGRILAAGNFNEIAGVPSANVARLLNDPATESLSVSSASRVEWKRGGASPEAAFVTFELSTDNGATFTPLGLGARIPGGWERVGLNLPAMGQIRARARTISGQNSGSSGLVESLVSYALPPSPTPDVTPPKVRVRGRKTIETLRKRVVIRGSVSDNVGVADLDVRVNRGARVAKAKVQGSSRFKVVLRISKTRGRVVAKIRAINTVGLRSRVERVRILRR